MVRSATRRFVGGNFCRQLHGHCLPLEPGRHSFFSSELHRTEDSPVGGVSTSCNLPSIHHGEAQHDGGCLISPESNSGLRMDAQAGLSDLCWRWPVSIDLFATSLNHRCSIYFSPYHDRNALGTDALLQSWNGWQAYAFPPWSLIPAVLKKLRSSSGVLLTIIASYWPQRPWFPDLLDLVVDGPIAPPLSKDLLRQPHFHRFHLGVSRLSLHAWRLSSDLLAPGVSSSM